MSYRDEQEDLSGTLIPRRKTASSPDRIVDPRASSGKSDGRIVSRYASRLDIDIPE